MRCSQIINIRYVSKGPVPVTIVNSPDSPASALEQYRNAEGELGTGCRSRQPYHVNGACPLFTSIQRIREFGSILNWSSNSVDPDAANVVSTALIAATKCIRDLNYK